MKGILNFREWDREKISTVVFYAVAVGLLVAFAGFLYWFVPGSIQRSIDYRQQTQELASQNEGLTTAIAIVNDWDARRLDSDLAKATVALPDGKKTSELISGLSMLASASGLVVRSIAYSPGQVSSVSAGVSPGAGGTGGLAIGSGGKVGVRVLSASMAVTADLSRVVDFLLRLKTTNQIVRVTTVQYGTTTDTSGVSANLALLVYYLPPAEGRIDWASVKRVDDKAVKLVEGLSGSDVFTLPKGSR